MESMHKQIIAQKLDAISESIHIIQERVRGFATIDDMLSSPYGMMVFDSCVMRLQTIGENIKSVDDRTEGKYLGHYPETPWKKIIGLRNIISHEYANIDPEAIWSIFQKHLNPLSDVIEKMRAELM